MTNDMTLATIDMDALAAVSGGRGRFGATLNSDLSVTSQLPGGFGLNTSRGLVQQLPGGYQLNTPLDGRGGSSMTTTLPGGYQLHTPLGGGGSPTLTTPILNF
jgi:hypothetical protein